MWDEQTWGAPRGLSLCRLRRLQEALVGMGNTAATVIPLWAHCDHLTPDITTRWQKKKSDLWGNNTFLGVSSCCFPYQELCSAEASPGTWAEAHLHPHPEAAWCWQHHAVGMRHCSRAWQPCGASGLNDRELLVGCVTVEPQLARWWQMDE